MTLEYPTDHFTFRLAVKGVQVDPIPVLVNFHRIADQPLAVLDFRLVPKDASNSCRSGPLDSTSDYFIFRYVRLLGNYPPSSRPLATRGGVRPVC